ncbi:MAG: hypothetical protein CL908_19670 [Deltaproteobacteria bacterium]|nr:hypothetical protein [Deltaproteobacteria bacterium]
MDLRNLFSFSRRRRVVDLRFRPAFQLRLPVLLLLVTAAFTVLFLAHTDEAYGMVAAIGFEEPWLRAIAEEIWYDYLVVSLSIVAAYVFVLMGVCLAAAHRNLGPILVLRRHLENFKKGDYTQTVDLRAGHPLSDLAEDLNELREMLRKAEPLESSGLFVVGETRRVGDQAGQTVDRLLAENLAESARRRRRIERASKPATPAASEDPGSGSGKGMSCKPASPEYPGPLPASCNVPPGCATAERVQVVPPASSPAAEPVRAGTGMPASVMSPVGTETLPGA